MTGRPRVYKTECVVLARRNIGEADSILTVFSLDQGRFDGVARGIRKARSRMGGHLEPLSRVKVLLAQGRTLDVFTQAQAVTVPRRVHEDLDRYAAATYAAELVRRFVPEREPQPWLYGLLVGLLEVLEEGARVSVLRAFEAHLLEGTGYTPRFGGCAACGARLPEEDAFFAPGAGGLLCRACRVGGETGRLISVGAVKVLRFAARTSLEEFGALRMSDDVDREVEAVMADAIRYALDAEPRSSHFLQEVRGLYRMSPGPVADRSPAVESNEGHE